MSDRLKRITVFFMAGITASLWQTLLDVKIVGDNAFVYIVGLWVILLAASDLARWVENES